MAIGPGLARYEDRLFLKAKQSCWEEALTSTQGNTLLLKPIEPQE